jgi:hypothetical protein
MNDPHYAAVEACVRGALSRFDISLHLCFDLCVTYSEKFADERVAERCGGLSPAERMPCRSICAFPARNAAPLIGIS